MNLDQLKRSVGARVKLVPPACHLDPAGDALAAADEDWTIFAVNVDSVEIGADTGHSYRLGQDHIRNFTSDPERSLGGDKRGFLTLHVQLFIEGERVWAIPNHQPGAPVTPPVNRALKARAFFAPELQRIFRRQIEILDRVIPNYTQTSLGRAPCPGDSWRSLMPWRPDQFPTSALLQDLTAADSELLAEFYASVQEVRETLDNWNTTDQPLDNYNAWNALMHHVQHSLRAGQLAAQRFCPERTYDATVPAAGTLNSRSERSLTIADGARQAFLDRATALGGKAPAVSNPMGVRPTRK
jgi:hypothetical protein